MALSGPEIQDNLRAFVAKWQAFAGTEKAEAQTFLNELFACYGLDRVDVGAKFEDFSSYAGFMDLHWPEICIIEMKRPNTPLETARDQVHRYRRESADEEEGIKAAKYVVICSFQKFEIWQPGDFPKNPRALVDLVDLPERYDVLNFLAGPNVEPSFVLHDRAMTKDAAEKVALMYESLVDRVAAPPQQIQRFVMQSVWCMFAEDLKMLVDWPFETIVDQLIKDPTRNSAEALGFLFRVLNQKGKHNRTGVLSGTAYVNGDLFAEPAEVNLNLDELRLLREAVSYNWSQVDPTIFGSLMEGVLGDRRWELGAHYTHEVDIMKIVGPTIVTPWTERIVALSTPQEARDLLGELCSFKVLDPACGCGNFLYVAYRELRALESLLKTRIGDLAQATGNPVPDGQLPFVPLSNMQGIEIEPASALIARVTLWMGHRQMIDLYGPAEDPLPLITLSTIQTADALRVSWPETDCIIGNPPFLGSQLIRKAQGDHYVDWIKMEFKVGIKDYCVYWFRRTVDHLKPGQRAGLVGTNSISQNRARSASLEYVVSKGGVITDAVSSQKWPGEAKVHVSLVNWIAEPNKPIEAFVIDGVEVGGVGTDLREALSDRWDPVVLPANTGVCFQGPIPVGAGFIIDASEAQALLARKDVNYSNVVRPYLTSDDIANSSTHEPSRWVVDFGTKSLEAAGAFPRALRIIRERVKPDRERNRDARFRAEWWRFGRPRGEMRNALEGLERYVATGRHSKRLGLAWAEAWTMASDATNVFAFDDDFSMAVLQSRAHVAWAWQQSSTLKGDLRYTPTSVFMTFPWPDRASEAQRERAADVCRRLLIRRRELCGEHQVGLTKLYNAMDEGAYADLKALHRELDEAIADCYGWPKAMAQDDKELVRRLTELNREIVEGDREYGPFTYLHG
ncbi:MAG: DNA methyltransferase [Aeromicrobium sp.]